MTTAAPLPTVGDLLHVFSAATADGSDQALAAPWRQSAETAFWLSRSAWALAVLVQWHRNQFRSVAPRLWLPDYFCNQSTAAARDAGAEIRFYPVDADLTPRWDDCARLADRVPPDLFVMVHFFGAAQPMATAQKFCRDHHATLIEDAAHVLRPAPGIGETGDVTFYSPHKLLAIPDGAVMLVKSEEMATAIAGQIVGLGPDSPLVYAWLAKRLLQKLLPEALLRRRTAAMSLGFHEDPPFQELASTPRPSPVALKMLSELGPQLDKIAETYRENALYLSEIIKDRTDLTIFGPARAAAVPYRLVLEFTTASAAEKAYVAWRRGGVPVDTWPDIAPEVAAARGIHSAALALRRRLLFLPLHQKFSSSLSAIIG
jgi:selenocysteine lyase/cysteine desulfurase